MDVEQEGGISEAPTTISGGEGSMDGVEKMWAAVLVTGGTIITTLLGLAYKNRRSSQSLEDTTNEVSRDTLVTLRARNLELENQVKQLMNDSTDNFRRMLKAEEAASQASIQSSISSAAATRAKASAEEALALVSEYQTRLANLIVWMKSKGIDPPSNY